MRRGRSTARSAGHCSRREPSFALRCARCCMLCLLAALRLVARRGVPLHGCWHPLKDLGGRSRALSAEDTPIPHATTPQWLALGELQARKRDLEEPRARPDAGSRAAPGDSHSLSRAARGAAASGRAAARARGRAGARACRLSRAAQNFAAGLSAARQLQKGLFWRRGPELCA